MTQAQQFMSDVANKAGYRLSFNAAGDGQRAWIFRGGKAKGYLSLIECEETGHLFPISSARGQFEAAQLREQIVDEMMAAGLVK